MFLPEADRYSYSKERLESQIASMFGGRIAEELVFGADSVTTGASNDIQRATEIARNMVTKWGLSEKLGPLTYMEEEGEVFLGHSVSQNKHISDETAHIIDEEIRVIIDRNYQRAENILQEQRDKLDAMAAALIKFETIDQEQIADIMAGKPPRPPADWSDDDASTNAPTDRGASATSADEKPDTDTKIGGPAGEH
jgi:cell division protease FtsH